VRQSQASRQPQKKGFSIVTVTYSDPHSPPTLSVSELNREAKHLLESHFDWVWVEGEIGNFTAASSGHWYFTLKDTAAQVRCAMFRGANSRVKVRPAQGDSVRIRARVSLYEGRGEFQLICEHLAPAGAGALQLAFERLKTDLANEGLFATDAKKGVPQHAEHVGVITSPTGAVLHDILTVLKRRSPLTRIYLFPVPVQGEGAAAQIAAAIHQADSLSQDGGLPLDVVIVGRGGGSLEDLWAFNEEVVARAIFAASIPVVSAVGHETDFSIADLVADVRAATPSAAAELISADQYELRQHVDALGGRMQRSLSGRLAGTLGQFAALQKRLRHPGHAVATRIDAMKRLNLSLHRSMRRQVAMRHTELSQSCSRLQAQHPRQHLAALEKDLWQGKRQLGALVRQRLQQLQTVVAHQLKLLSSLGPEQTLNRGYAIVTDQRGLVLKQPSDANKGDALRVRVKGGALTAIVEGHPED